MYYYYKQIDENGEVISVLSCGNYLRESETQIQITEEEYNEYIASLPEPEEPEPTDDVSPAEFMQMVEEVL